MTNVCGAVLFCGLHQPRCVVPSSRFSAIHPPPYSPLLESSTEPDAMPMIFVFSAALTAIEAHKYSNRLTHTLLFIGLL